MIVKNDTAIAGRLREFRKKYVEKNSYDAAALLGISQSRLSRLEHGEAKMDAATIKKLVEKYNLNRDWLLDNKGKPVITDTKKTNTITDISEIKERTFELLTEINILNKNMTKLWQMVEAQGREIEALKMASHQGK